MKHEVFLADRGGRDSDIIEKLDGLTSVRWSRVRDDVSEHDVTLYGMGKDCRKALSEPGLAMRKELVVKRNGQRVWEGPIIRSHLTGSTAKLACRDILLFAQRTPCLLKHSSAFGSGGPQFVTARTMKIWETEMAIWEEWGANLMDNIVVRQNAQTAKTTRVSEKGSQYVWDDMEELAARAGMDYTVANRSLYLFDTHQFLGMGRRLTDADFLSELEVVEYGLELAVRSLVTDGQGHFATSTLDDDYYGPFGLLASAYTVNTATDRIPQSELADQAKRNARSRYPAPVVLRVPESSQLRPDAVDDLMPFLIPGTGFPVFSESTGRRVEMVQKLDRVNVEENEQGETVSLTMSAAPIGSGLEGDIVLDGA